MSAQNYKVHQYENNNAGRLFFLLGSSMDCRRVGSVMPAIIDHDENGQIFRVEVTYLQYELRQIGIDIVGDQVDLETEVILQVGDNNPTSLLLWLESLYTKSRSHIRADAWILLNEKDEFHGLEIIVNQ